MNPLQALLEESCNRATPGPELLARIERAQKALASSLSSKWSVERVFASGALRRRVATLPLGPVELLAVLDEERHAGRYRNWEGATGILRELATTLQAADPAYRARPRGGSLSVRVGEDSFSLLPAFPREDGSYDVPLPSKRRWIRQDPDARKSFTAQADRELRRKGLPVVRLLQRWNRLCSVKLEPFHLEVLALRALLDLEALPADVLQTLGAALIGLRDGLGRPCADPGDPSARLDRYLDERPGGRFLATDAAERALATLDRAFQETAAGQGAAAREVVVQTFG